MPSNGTVQYDVIASVNEAIAAQRLLAKEINTSVKQMAADLGGTLPRAAEQAGRAHDGLLGKVQAFAREQRQQGRIARFYAGEVMSLIPAAEGGKSVLQGLAGVLVEGAAGGLSFGVALETAKLAIDVFTASQREAAVKAKAHHDQLVAITDAFEKYQRMARGASQTELTFLDVTKKDRDALFQMQKELGVVNEKLAVMRERRQTLAMGGLLGRRAELEDEIKKARERIDIARAAKEEADKASQAGAAPAARKGVADKEIEESRKALERKKRLEEQFRQMDVESTKRAEDEKRKAMEDATKRGDEILRKMAEADRKNAEETLKLQVEQTKKAEDEKFKGLVDAKKRGDEILRKMEEDEKRYTEQQVNDAVRIGSALGGALASAKSEADVFKAALLSSMDVIREIAIKAIMAAAAKSAAEAYASQAGIPIVGPILGAAAAAAAFSLVSGYVASLDVGTWKVPRDQLAMVHKGEIITPAPMSEAIRSGKATLGAGGGGVTNNTFVIHAFDGPDVERTLLKIRDRLGRNGRWPGV